MPDQESVDAAWRLFSFIAEKDPGSVATKDDAIAVFRECVDALRKGDARGPDMPAGIGRPDADPFG